MPACETGLNGCAGAPQAEVHEVEGSIHHHGGGDPVLGSTHRGPRSYSQGDHREAAVHGEVYPRHQDRPPWAAVFTVRNSW